MEKSKKIIKASGRSVVSKPKVSKSAAFAVQKFRVSIGGKKMDFSVNSGYGYFISSFRRAETLEEISKYVERGIQSREIKFLIKYLDFTVPEIAKAAAVSPSTVSRWEPGSSIGQPGSSQFFKMDEVIRKGVHLFGGESQLKSWLISPNLALGNAVPSKLITSAIGVDLIDEALDALSYGNVM